MCVSATGWEGERPDQFQDGILVKGETKGRRSEKGSPKSYGES